MNAIRRYNVYLFQYVIIWELIDKINYGYHPYHAFSMISCGHIAEMACCAIYIVGAYEPGIARSMGMKTRATFEEALEDAKKKYIGPDPDILALPKAFTTAAVHLEPVKVNSEMAQIG